MSPLTGIKSSVSSELGRAGMERAQPGSSILAAIFSNEHSMAEQVLRYTVVLGDWSDDGHGEGLTKRISACSIGPMDSSTITPDRPRAAVGRAKLLKFSYVALTVDPELIIPLNRELQVLLGDDYAELKGNRDSRDGEDRYHMTVVAPGEFRALKRTPESKRLQIPEEPIPFEILGIGTAAHERSRAWFAVCRSEAVAAWRSDLGLPAHDLHITLAFGAGGDVHGEPKGISSLIAV